jgi:cytochrome bd-type quinol oxidase subunit 1
MNFPVWDIPFLGGGLLIAIIAVTHAFVSHFAIGGGLFLVLTEKKAYREGDDRILEYLKGHALFFILLTLVFGALTGVGIWFSIGLVHPSGTSALIHAFVWGWAIEWVFFLVEVTAAFVYFYAWDRLDKQTHLKIGWIYFGAAWLSLFIINGILAFMLTPGRWLETRNFWLGFFNPTYFPSLFLRTLVTLALAGLYALVTSSFLEPTDLRIKMVRYSAKWLMPAFFLMPIGLIWYLSQVPESSRQIILGGAPAVTMFAGLSLILSVIIFLFIILGPYRRPDGFAFPFALLILVLGFMVTGTTEWVREAIRKPFIISDYMYSNGILVGQEGQINQKGILATARWVSNKEVIPGKELEAGRDIYRIECQSCHTIIGYNGIKPLIRGWNEEFIDHQLQNLKTLKGFMPPFVGTEVERKALASWLASLNPTQP